MPSDTGQAYYQANYADYQRQTSPAKLRFYRALLERWVAHGSAIVEVGFGLGDFLASVCTDYACTGCEPNAFGLATARTRVPQARLLPGSVECLRALPPQRAVIAWDVLEHLPALPDALAAIREALEAQGVLLAVVPVYDGPLGWLVHWLDRDPTHLSKLSRGAWCALLTQAGFTIVESGGIIRRLIAARWYLHLTRPQWVLRSLGSALYVVARKTAASAVTHPEGV